MASYTGALISELKSKMNHVILVAAGVNLFTAIVLALMDFSNPFIWISLGTCLWCLALYILRSKLSFEQTVVGAISWCILFAGLSFFFHGILGTGETILFFIMTLSISLLSLKFSRNLLILGLGVYIGANVANQLFRQSSEEGLQGLPNLLLNTLALAFLILALRLILIPIRNSLFSTIEHLQAQIQKTEQQAEINSRKDEEIRKLAFYDDLTGLPNRNLFRSHVEKRLETGIARGLMLLMDIQDFRIINTTMGSEYGDMILIDIGKAFQDMRQDRFFTARFSGNEFAIWLEYDTREGVEATANLFAANLRIRFERIMEAYQIRFHSAYSLYPAHGESYEDCDRRVNIALRHAKSHNILGTIAFEESMESAIAEEARIRNSLETAIAQDEFTIVYQQKVEPATRIIHGVEALARWDSSILGIVPPSDFIPEIARANMTTRFGRLILNKVLRDIPALVSQYGEHVKVSVNISPLFFMEENFCGIVREEIMDNKVSPSCLMLEITEDVFIHNFETIRQHITVLRGMGIGISLDDFGSGYSSLMYLKNLELDELKIDKSIIDGILLDERNYLLLLSIVNIARVYGFGIVAEGVETEAQLAKVVEADIGLVQGYVFSRPASLAEVRNVH